MRSYGIVRCTAECSACGAEVEFTYQYDRSVNAASYEDTAHQAPTGQPCDLAQADVESAVEMATSSGPEREWREDR